MYAMISFIYKIQKAHLWIRIYTMNFSITDKTKAIM
jgi:hypothetical protein